MKRKIESMNYDVHRTYTIDKDLIYVINCNTDQEAEFLITKCNDPNIKFFSRQGRYVVLEPEGNNSNNTILNAEIAAILNKKNNTLQTPHDFLDLIDAHFGSPAWRTLKKQKKEGPSQQSTKLSTRRSDTLTISYSPQKVIAKQIQDRCNVISQKQFLFHINNQMGVRLFTIEQILYEIKAIESELVKLMSILGAQKDQLEKFLPSKSVQDNYLTIKKMQEKVELLICIIDNPEKNTEILELIAELLNNLPKWNHTYNQLKLSISPKYHPKRTHSFFNTRQILTATEKNFDTTETYNDKLVNKLLHLMINIKNVYVQEVMSPFPAQQSRASFAISIIRGILNANENKTTLIPFRIESACHTNYLIGVVIKQNCNDIVIKYIDSYGSFFNSQFIIDKNQNWQQYQPNEANLIIDDIYKVNLRNVTLQHILSNELLQFIDILMAVQSYCTQEINLLNIGKKIKFVASGIIQQAISNPDSGPYVVYNLISELNNTPLEKCDEWYLRTIHQHYLDQSHNPIFKQ